MKFTEVEKILKYKKLLIALIMVALISGIALATIGILKSQKGNNEEEFENKVETENQTGLTEEEKDILKYKLSDNYTVEYGMDSLKQFEINLKSGDVEVESDGEKFVIGLINDEAFVGSEKIDTYAEGYSNCYLIDLDKSDIYKEVCVATLIGMDGYEVYIYRITKNGLEKIYEKIWVENVEYIKDKLIISKFLEAAEGFGILDEHVVIGYETYENGKFVKVDRYLTGEKFEENILPKKLKDTIFTSRTAFYDIDSKTRCVIENGTKIKLLKHDNKEDSFGNYIGNHTIQIAEDIILKVYEWDNEYKLKEEKLIEAGTILENVRCVYGDAVSYNNNAYYNVFNNLNEYNKGNVKYKDYITNIEISDDYEIKATVLRYVTFEKDELDNALKEFEETAKEYVEIKRSLSDNKEKIILLNKEPEFIDKANIDWNFDYAKIDGYDDRKVYVTTLDEYNNKNTRQDAWYDIALIDTEKGLYSVDSKNGISKTMEIFEPKDKEAIVIHLNENEKIDVDLFNFKENDISIKDFYNKIMGVPQIYGIVKENGIIKTDDNLISYIELCFENGKLKVIQRGEEGM